MQTENARIKPVGPTPETLAKLEPDQILKLHDLNMIDGAGLRAADQIATIHSAITRDSAVKVPSIGIGDMGKYELPDDIANKFSKIYVPWRASLDPVVADFVVQVAVTRSGMTNDVDHMVVAQCLTQYARRM